VRLTAHMRDLGFTVLPCILWRKQTNAPNKFLGSGMLPAGAYVTLEHEYLLIFRKGPKRAFKTHAEKSRRRASAIFWEERNAWFSDVWMDVKGTPQTLGQAGARPRSAAYPFEIAHRLINMYSVKGDTVLDPFWGTGTTTLAAIVSGRSSIGYEIDPALASVLDRAHRTILTSASQCLKQRLTQHVAFVCQRLQSGTRFKHTNVHYGFPVVTAQEKELLFNRPSAFKKQGPNAYEVSYENMPQAEFCRNWDQALQGPDVDKVLTELRTDLGNKNSAQMALFDG
jgi:modification methylase